MLARTPDAPPAQAAATPGDPQATTHPFGLWLALYALSGFVALSLEILWFRLVDVAVKSTAFTFGTVLAIYLLGSAAGSLLALALVRPAAPAARASSCSPSARSCCSRACP